MRKFTLLCSAIALLLAFNSPVQACNNSSAALNSITSSGGGNYSIVMDICIEMLGMEGIPDEFNLEFYPNSLVINSFSPSSRYGNPGNTNAATEYTGAIGNSPNDHILRYTQSQTFPTGNDFCFQVTLEVNGFPDSVLIRTHEGRAEADCNRWVYFCPDLYLSPISEPICQLDPAFALSAMPIGGVWSGPGVSGSNFDPAVAGIGSHSVVYTYTGGCVTSDSITILVAPCTEREVGVFSELEIFPQPVSSMLTIRTGSQALNFEVEILNLTGQSVYQDSLEGGTEYTIPITQLRPGIYLLKFISSEGDDYSQKLVVE